MIGQTYMLGEDEELWEKSLPAIVKVHSSFFATGFSMYFYVHICLNKLSFYLLKVLNTLFVIYSSSPLHIYDFFL